MLSIILFLLWLFVALYQIYYGLQNHNLIEEFADDLLLNIPMVTIWFNQGERLNIVYFLIVIHCLSWPIVLLDKLIKASRI